MAHPALAPSAWSSGASSFRFSTLIQSAGTSMFVISYPFSASRAPGARI
jgi:hypothetical protein